MASYQNPQPREGINTSNEHPLKEFAQLVLGIGLLIIVGLFILNFLVGSLAKYIPFEFEKSMVSKLEVLQLEPSKQQRYLQSLADRLAQRMELDHEITITVHYSDSDVMNAFATAGGHVFFFKGLVSEMESEQELAAVMAHEIAHIKHRHPIVALGKGITLGTLMAFIGGASGSSAGDWLIGSSINLSLLQFSRDQERAADASAAEALYKTYGDIGGADKLFKRLAALEGSSEGDKTEEAGGAKNSKTLEIFRSHPFSNQRWQTLKQLANANNWPLSGSLTPLDFPKFTLEDRPD